MTSKSFPWSDPSNSTFEHLVGRDRDPGGSLRGDRPGVIERGAGQVALGHSRQSPGRDRSLVGPGTGLFALLRPRRAGDPGGWTHPSQPGASWGAWGPRGAGGGSRGGGWAYRRVVETSVGSVTSPFVSEGAGEVGVGGVAAVPGG